MPNFSGEHALLTGIMVTLILGAVLVISLVMLWAPSRPFPDAKKKADMPRPDSSPKEKSAKAAKNR